MLQVMHRGDDYERVKEAFTKQLWSQVLLYFPHLEDKVCTLQGFNK